MIQPPYLKQGSFIGITCPASAVALEKIAAASEVLIQKGFRIKLGATAGTNHFYFSGTDEERLTDLQKMLDDPEIDAILMGRGGYGMSRIIDQLDFSRFAANPKWVCGFSDIIVLQNHLQARFNISCLHSPMCGAFTAQTLNTPHLDSFYAALQGGPLKYEFPAGAYNRPGNAEGILTGGNLAILSHLTGSVSEVDTDGKILFLEDIGEYLYNADRMLLHLKRAGKLDKLAGLILGGFTEMQDTERPFGQTIEQIVSDKVKEYSYPVAFNFPAGHQDLNYTLSLGCRHKLNVTERGATLELIR